MIKRVKIMPRMAVHSLANEDFYEASVLASLPKADNYYLISINGSDEDLLTVSQIEKLKSKGFKGIVSFKFDDIGGDIWEAIVRRKNLDRSTFIEFSETQLDIALNAFDEFDLEPYTNDCLVIHCHAGISRSAAFGAAFAYSRNLDAQEFILMNPNIDPNKFILTKFLKGLGGSMIGYSSWLNNSRRKSRLSDS
jgi:hypothetical protein